MPRRWLKVGREGSKIQRLKFDSIFFIDDSLVDKEKFNLRKKVQNQMFMDLIKFY